MKRASSVRNTVYATLILLGYTGTAVATDVAVCTDIGNFTIELFDVQAPLHTANFLEYVDRAHYTGTVFHRVIAGFVVQGGGYNRDFRNKVLLNPVPNESRNGIGNGRGTLAAARTADPHSATAQFFVNLSNNSSLNASGGEWGYTVFGQVRAGMEVIDEIASLPTGAAGPFPSEVPEPLVAVTSMARVVEDRYPDLTEEARHEALAGDIQAAINSGDNVVAAAAFGEYRAACGDLGPELLFAEAKVLAAVDRNAAAIESLGEYLRVADNTSETYLEALSLSRELDPSEAEARAQEQLRLGELTGHCEFPSIPSIPDARDTTMEAMVEAQTDIRAFIELSDELLECLEEIVEDDDRDEDDHNLSITAYNRAVQEQEDLAARWNEQRELFLSLQ
jgi:cyclophilin family peptidyl-prolyl cis-trans isomerase